MRFTSTKVQNGPNVTEVLTGSDSKSVSATKMGTTDYHDVNPGGRAPISVTRNTTTTDVTVDTVSIAELTQTVTVGNWYTVMCRPRFEDISVGDGVAFTIKHDGETKGAHTFLEDTHPDGPGFIGPAFATFRATATSITFDATSLSSPSKLAAGTYVEIIDWGNQSAVGELGEITHEKLLTDDLDDTDNGVISDFTISDLTVGLRTKVTINMYISPSGSDQIIIAGSQGGARVASSTLGKVSESIEFVATSATMTFTASSIGSGSIILGNNSKAESWVQVTQYRQNDTVIGEAEYTDLSGGWVSLSTAAPSVDLDIIDLVNGRDFDDIEIEFDANTDSTSTAALYIYFNEDYTDSNYNYCRLIRRTSGDESNAGNEPLIGRCSDNTTNQFLENKITLKDYKSTDRKRHTSSSFSGNADSGTDEWLGIASVTHKTQIAALSDVRIAASAGNFGIGTRYRVLGVKKGNKGGGMVIESQDQWPTVSNNSVDPDADIDISPGTIADSTASMFLRLSSSITKQLDAVFAAGSGAGGRASAVSLTADTMYHVFLIQKDDDGTVDAYFDTSIVAANIPTGYTKYSYQMSVLTDSSSDIVGFTHIPKSREVYYNQSIQDLATGNEVTSYTLKTVSVPAETTAIIRAYVRSSDGTRKVMWLKPSWSNVDLHAIENESSGVAASRPVVRVPVDSNSQIMMLMNSTSNITTQFWTSGYKY